MLSGENIKRYTEDELRAMQERGESQTDMARVLAKSEAELERDIAEDPDDTLDPWWETAVAVPAMKKLLSLRVDADVVEWFREQGPVYQTRMNAVLRAYATRGATRGAKRQATKGR